MKKIILLLILAVLVAGCTQQPVTPGPPGPNEPTPEPVTPGPPGPNEPTPEPVTPGLKEFSVVIGHTFYNPSTITVFEGDTVRIKAVAASGTGSHKHGITIDEYGINQAVTTEDANNPVIIQFFADKKGTFTIYCKTCWDGPFGKSHPDIRGTLVVQG